MTYEQIKKNFDRKLWNEQMVALAVTKEIITSEEYEEITGKSLEISSRGFFQFLKNDK